MTPEAREQNRRSFISDAVEALNRSLDYAETLSALARYAVPAIADWCAVDILENGVIERLAVAHVDPAKVALAQEIARRWPTDPSANSGVAGIIKTGRPQLVEEITDEMIAAAPCPEQRAALQALGLRSWIGVPLRRGDQTIGAISLIMAESGRRYDSADLALAVTLADRASSAIGNAHVMRELERAHEQAEAANRAKDEFLAMLGHELRNPLAPILTALELMQLKAPEVCERERSIILRQVRHVVRLVDDLLDVSRFTRGNIELVKDEIDIADTIGKAIEMASPLLEERTHELVTSIRRGLVVHADPVRLAQVISNLVTNAAKYTERGGRITISATREDDRIAVRVKDTGAGIAPEVLPHVFETFYQSPQALDRKQGGLGLGLAIVKMIVALHGGEVTATSAGRGTGSEFTVWLPAVAAPSRPRAPIGTPVRGARPLSRESVLVVDDNPDALSMLADALESRGFDIHRAHDAPSALALARTIRPRVALLDIGLPVMDGYELARKLRELPGLETLQMVAVTGYGQPSDLERSRREGFVAHLIKPFSLDAVQMTIEQLLANEPPQVA